MRRLVELLADFTADNISRTRLKAGSIFEQLTEPDTSGYVGIADECGYVYFVPSQIVRKALNEVRA